MILDLAIEQTATEAGKNIAAVAIAFVVVATKGPADEVALFVLMEDQRDVQHEEAADEAATEAETVAARLELLREETTDEPADIAASEESLEPNMNKGPKLSECTSFVQKNVHRGLRFFRCGNGS